ncbi:MAG: helix-turn-helix transcriptional regulator [Aquincola sp.]|nr:helix-turn-helix transcriptional regulator [Aquincola sp.]|tara:strand:- start:20743 stop:21147 length:405 start_codon:yes stop_codon:yes gene_type:complete
MTRTDVGQAFSTLRTGIGARLREERERLGASQERVADWFGVQRQSVLLYEGGQRSPLADQLAAFHREGGDAGYVVTGVRRDGEPTADNREELMQAMAAVDTVCQSMATPLDGKARLKLAYEILDGVRRAGPGQR